MQTEPRRTGTTFTSSPDAAAPTPREDPVFTVAAVTLGRSALVRLRGELDLAAAPHLREALELLVRSFQQRVVLDLSDLTFVDCAGVQEILRARTRLRARDGDLCLRAASSTCVRILEVLELTDLLSGTPRTGAGANDRE